MTKAVDIRVGTAGWSISGVMTSRFDSAGTHLQRYSRRLACAEINLSFHRPHTVKTYAKWRDSTPPGFRFAVKMPRAITHDLKLQHAREPFVTFLSQTDGLADKRGPLLFQLPPSLSFDGSVVPGFPGYGAKGRMTAPSSASRGTPRGSRRVWHHCSRATEYPELRADPPPASEAATPAGWPRVVYFRLHGSPRRYWSRYDEHAIPLQAVSIGGHLGRRAGVVCVRQHRERCRPRERVGTS